MTDGLVLHVAAPPGGGVDRYVRDLARGSAFAHALWHATHDADAIEMPCGGRCWPLAMHAFERERDTLALWLRQVGVGAVHVHSLAPAARQRAQAIAALVGAPIVATLHDVLFLDPAGFDASGAIAPDPEWIAQVGPFLRACGAVLAPSHFIAHAAREHLGLDVAVVPNGIEPAPGAFARPHREFTERRPRHVAAVLGAIGPHKGSAIVDALAHALAGSGIGLAVIGYLDAQVQRGWRGESLYVHGPFVEDDTAAWLDAYGAALVIFPNRVPESFSYALSEAWAARRPAVVPDEGALGERVREHAGGWLVPPRSDAATFEALLRRLFAAGAEGEIARVQSVIDPHDAARIPRLTDMTRSLDALYRRFGLEPRAPIDAASVPAQSLLATSLDASLFRVELVRLADELVQLREGLAAERAQAAESERQSRAWIAKLEADLAHVQGELAAEVAQRRACEDARFELQQEVARLEAALARLPSFVRRYLVRRPPDGRS